ncbi:DUF6929 family protein [Aquabacterium sp.]|uniref:DUF6929 family protein n=1 Tax=Aquabacterium sp. TaxID=1872578 RepID=UPI002CAF1678|nr:hypothetical protein [Aquabacterium sp.]HSW07249.1 hypothetical protein [Aquabacterium sp.]
MRAHLRDDEAAVLLVQTLRTLSMDAAAGPGRLSAASGLAHCGEWLHVVADDELKLASFRLGDAQPGRWCQLFDGDLPLPHAARKAAKPDLEALALLPPFAGHACGALLAMGSGSTTRRQRAALVPLDAQGQVSGAPQVIDVAPLLASLRAQFADLNIEGAFVDGERFCLLQRGHQRDPANACIAFDWPAVQRWLVAAGPAPVPDAIARFELGHIGGAALCFTDGAALPEGGFVFCAAAEQTDDVYADGACLGSAVGLVDAQGRLQRMEPLALRCKAEGISTRAAADGLQLLLVTDADDRSAPALLLSATLR